MSTRIVRTRWSAQRRFLAVTFGVLASALLLPLASCSSGSGGGGHSVPSSAVGIAPDGHAIHVFAVQTDGTKKELDFSRGTEVTGFSGTTASRPVAAARPGVAANSLASLLHLGLKGSSKAQLLDLQASKVSKVSVDTGGTGTSPIQPAPTIGNPDPGNEYPSTFDTGYNSTAWALAERAAIQCFSEQAQTSNIAGLATQNDDFSTDVLIPPWLSDGVHNDWFVYLGLGQSCDVRMLQEQNLLCVADKLAAVGDAIGTTVWPAVDPSLNGGANCPSSGGQSFTYGSDAAPSACEPEMFVEWDIPPQADADRFIVRDLAIHTLALVPTLDALPFENANCPNSTSPECTCAEIYADVMNKTLVATNGQGLEEAFGTPAIGTAPAFPPTTVPLFEGMGSTVTTDNSVALATTASEIEAQVLRAGGRLLHDLIRRNVYSDMAAAAQQSAHALDPALGNSIAWGLGKQGPYGTLAHAARVLAGRWEIGDTPSSLFNHGDPQCEGVLAINELTQAFGNDLSARVQDVPIRTPGEAQAANLIENAGIVLPSCAINGAGASTLRTALAAQLLRQEQVRDGVTPNSSAPLAAVFTAVTNRLSDAEVTFGFQHALGVYRILTNSADEVGLAADGGVGCTTTVDVGPPGVGIAGLLPVDASAVDPSISGLYGVVFAGGVTTSRLSPDPMARAGGLTLASQCNDNTADWDVSGTTVPPQYGAPYVDNSLPPSAFQDAFSMGQTFEHRLTFLRDKVASSSTGDPGDPEPIARGAIAELKSWAGSAMAITSPIGPTALEFLTVGLDYSDLGINAGLVAAGGTALDQAILSKLGLVWGPAWTAECAAHVSKSCPANFDATVVHPQPLSGSAVDVTSQVGDLQGVEGLPTPIFFMQIVPPTAALQPPATPGPQNSRLYLVQLSDPGSQTGQGKVLGTVKLPFTSGSSPVLDQTQVNGFVIAPMQRELLDAAINTGKWVGAAPPRLGDSTTADPSGYCVDGVPRNIFVPLQNELTSDTGASFEDSWQHYLDIAQQAATTADALGQQLLDQNLQISERDEAAGEQLADLCGDVGALSQTTTDTSGNVSASTSDTSLQSCLNEPTVDFVTLANIPTSLMTPDPQTWVRGILHCTTPNDPKRDPLCDKSSISIGSLNVKPFTQVAPTPPPVAGATASTCVGLGIVAANRPSGFQSTNFEQAIATSTFGISSMQQVANSTNMTVDLSDNWTVSYQGTKIMDSQSTTLWPGCLRSGNSCGNVLTQPYNFALNEAFRYCPAIPSNNTAPLLSTPLGSTACDPNAPATNPDMAELNMIKWRVEGALWTIAASAGSVPSGMFTMPIPVVISDTPPYALSSIGALYTGHLQAANGGYELMPEQGKVTSAQSLAFGRAQDMPAAWRAFPTYANGEIPLWYLTLFTPNFPGFPNPAYPHNVQAAQLVPASNQSLQWTCGNGSPDRGLDPGSPTGGMSYSWAQAINSGSGSTPPRLFDSCDSDTKTTNLSLAQTLDDGAWTLDGIKCRAPYGEPSGGAPGLGPNGYSLVAVLNGMRTNFDASPFSGPCTAATGFSLDPAWSEFVAGADYAPMWHSCNDYYPLSGDGFPPFGNIRTPNPSPSVRVNTFANMSAMNGTCDAVSNLVGAAALSCVALAQPVAPDSSAFLAAPPAINSMTDVPSLQRWQGTMGSVLDLDLQQLYVENVPQRVIDDFQAGTVGSGAKAGVHGQDILDMEEALDAIPGAWSGVGSDLTRISEAIQGMSLAVKGANLAQSSAFNQAALQAIQIQGQMTQASDAFFSSVVGTIGSAVVCVATEGAGCGALVGSLSSLVSTAQSNQDEQQTGTQEELTLNTQNMLAQSQAENEVAQAIVGLNETTTPLWADLQTQIDNIRTSTLKMQAAGADLQLTTSKAQYQAALGTGSDVVTVGGQTIPIPVNTVLNRQASATQIRYDAALKNAKALAYMARRAIEQRLGIPLNAITQPVGALDAPASWADDICSLTGINYQALSTATAPDAGGQGSTADNTVVTQFADSFVGDYVTKLSNFVQYFNVQYPSHQGSDTAVLSLRSDLLDPIAQCTQTAPNLLHNSGGLDDELTPPQVASGLQGWQLPDCDPNASTCLNVISGATLAPPFDGPGAGLDTWDPNAPVDAISNGSTGITWLVDVTQSGGDAGAATTDDAGAGDGGVTPILPPGMVTQGVSLQAGSYVLSWWDQARDPSGNLLLGSPGTKYVARVYDGGFNQVAQFLDFPYSATQDGSVSLWSARHALTFQVSSPGTYYVSFGASTADESPGSVAIADVQLEAAQSNGGPSTYVATSDTRVVTAYGCPPSDGDLRAAFVHTCDNTGACYYDLTTPIVIDTQSLNNGTSPLAGKLAQGNYNFRHVNLALNLVGTGVHDCTNTPTPACYGNGYIEYTLEHDATDAGILDWNGNVRYFDFGIADVQHGKALAAERYISMPLGSDDQSLISQPGIEHIEFAGRPLDGRYHLRIYDSPALQWNQLQDVQIVLNYEYWSEIVANGITQGN